MSITRADASRRVAVRRCGGAPPRCPRPAAPIDGSTPLVRSTRPAQNLEPRVRHAARCRTRSGRGQLRWLGTAPLRLYVSPTPHAPSVRPSLPRSKTVSGSRAPARGTTPDRALSQLPFSGPARLSDLRAPATVKAIAVHCPHARVHTRTLLWCCSPRPMAAEVTLPTPPRLGPGVASD